MNFAPTNEVNGYFVKREPSERVESFLQSCQQPTHLSHMQGTLWQSVYTRQVEGLNAKLRKIMARLLVR